MGVADRRVAAVVQRVVGEPALADVRPAVVVAPVGERVRLPQLVCRVPAELRRVRARRRLVAADAGDPAVEVAERADQRLDLGDGKIEVGLALPELLAVSRCQLLGARALEQLDLRVVPPLHLAPELVRLREEVVGVDREDARFRLDAEEHVEQHSLLLLEGAGERDALAEALDHRGDELLGGELLGAGGESGDVVVGGGRHRGSDGTSADGPFITATNPNYKVYGVSGDDHDTRDRRSSSPGRPRPRGVRRLVHRRRGACRRRGRQHPPRRLLDPARGVREADRPLPRRCRRRRLVPAVVRRLRRAEPSGRGRPPRRCRRVLARARHDAPGRVRRRRAELERRRAQGHGHRLRRRLHGSQGQPEGDQDLGRPDEGRRRGADAEPVHVRRRPLERDGRLRRPARAGQDARAGARLPEARCSRTWPSRTRARASR